MTALAAPLTANSTAAPAAPTVLITPEVDFHVEIRTLMAQPRLKVPNNAATVRVNKDNAETVLAVVGDRYQVIDHRDVIKDFAEALGKAGFVTDVEHHVHHGGAHLYSRFTLQQQFELDFGDGVKQQARPYLTLLNSYDGAFKLGFVLGAKVNGMCFNLSPQVYQVSVKHMHGAKLSTVLEQVSKAVQAFVSDVVPKWQAMATTRLTPKEAARLVEQAVKLLVISPQRAKGVDSQSVTNLWDLCSALVQEVSKKAADRETEESGFWRNAKANQLLLDRLVESKLKKK